MHNIGLTWQLMKNLLAAYSIICSMLVTILTYSIFLHNHNLLSLTNYTMDVFFHGFLMHHIGKFISCIHCNFYLVYPCFFFSFLFWHGSYVAFGSVFSFSILIK